MKVVYIAGPYRASTEYGVLQNIRMAEELALRVWRCGAACICPHKNTAFLGGACDGDDGVWLRGDLELLSRCDAVLCVVGWQSSQGAAEEVAFARRHPRIMVFESFECLERWLRMSSQERMEG